MVMTPVRLVFHFQLCQFDAPAIYVVNRANVDAICANDFGMFFNICSVYHVRLLRIWSMYDRFRNGHPACKITMWGTVVAIQAVVAFATRRAAKPPLSV